MYHIAILDDERKEAEHIKELADVYFDRKELMQRRIDIFHNGNELLAHVKAIPCDLLFLDIEVGQENGIEIGRKLRQIAPDMIIVVITGYLIQCGGLQNSGCTLSVEAGECTAFIQ